MTNEIHYSRYGSKALCGAPAERDDTTKFENDATCKACIRAMNAARVIRDARERHRIGLSALARGAA